MDGKDESLGNARFVDESKFFTFENLEATRSAYLAEQENPKPSPLIKFKYAECLTRSPKRDDKYRGIGLLKDLIDEGFNTTDCLYSIALSYFAIGQYGESRKHCERLLRRDPQYRKGLALHQCIKETVSKDGAMGLGIAAGALVAVGFAINFLLKSRR